MDYAPEGNGRLDPCEIVPLIVTLKNFGGSAKNVTAKLATTDSHVAIHQADAEYGDLNTGTESSNIGTPFVIEAVGDVSSGHVAKMSLSISDDNGEYATTFDLLIGQNHYMVWDPTPDASGGALYGNILSSLGYTGGRYETLPISRLPDTQTLFVSAGVYDNNYIIMEESPQAAAIVGFLFGGGRVYLEGNDVWYYDPIAGGYDFKFLFGIDAPLDGTEDLPAVRGVPGTFADGMTLGYEGELSYMDRISPVGSAELVLECVAPVYGCGVSNEAWMYKTIGTSFEIAGLVDGAPPSTRMNLISAIMDFFLPATVGVADGVAPATFETKLTASPNPFNPMTEIAFDVPAPGFVRLTVHDLSGRRVRMLSEGTSAAGSRRITWDGTDDAGRVQASGVYFVRLHGDGVAGANRLVLLK